MDKDLPNKGGVLLDTYDCEKFSRDAIRQFPALREDLEDVANLLHPQMGILGEAVRAALASGEVDLPLRVCRFLESALKQPRAVSEIENAVAISFVDAWEFRESETGRRVLSEMPDGVRKVLLEQERRWDNIGSGSGAEGRQRTDEKWQTEHEKER